MLEGASTRSISSVDATDLDPPSYTGCLTVVVPLEQRSRPEELLEAVEPLASLVTGDGSRWDEV